MSELLVAFQDIYANSGTRVEPSLVPIIESGIADPHTGIFVADFVRASMQYAERQDLRFPIMHAPGALAIYGSLMAQTGDRYRATTPSVPAPESEIWQQHVRNVRNGDIVISLPQDSWMTRSEGRRQVYRADFELGRSPGDVQVALSMLNYGFFRAQTMANAQETLSVSPEEIANSTSLAKMPWLQATNWVGAEIAQHSLEQMSLQRKGALHVIDICAGTGSTSATIINRLVRAQTAGHVLSQGRLSLLAVEATPDFVYQYTHDFLPNAHDQIADLGLSILSGGEIAVPQVDRLQTGSIGVVEGDVVSTLENMDFSNIGSDDVVELHVNYGAHRLTSNQKEAILTNLDTVENCIFIVGDLWENGSPVNLGYFNEGYNGAVNPGNVGLENALSEHGFKYITVAIDASPNFIDEALLSRLQEEHARDGRVVIAYKGQLAQSIIESPKIR